MSIAIKAADEFGKKVDKQRQIHRIPRNYKKLLSIAASIVFVIVCGGYVVKLYKANIALTKSNNILSETLSETQNKVRELQEMEHYALHSASDMDQSEIEKSIGDSEYLSSVLALNKVIASINEVNEMSYTRDIDLIRSVFPSKSNLIDNNNAFISLGKMNKDVPLNLTLINYSTNDTVHKVEGYNKMQIPLRDLPIVEGVKYRWILNYKKKEVGSGDFYALTSNEKKQIERFDFHTAQDYVKAFTYYYSNGYYFDAQATLYKGINAYPNTELFNYLQQLLMNDR
jgi:hypothetical protein